VPVVSAYEPLFRFEYGGVVRSWAFYDLTVATTEPSLRPARQERSRASLERLLAAGTRLLEEKGYEGFTLAEVSRRARVSIGSIYARVESKDALFQAIHERFMAELTEAYGAFDEAGRWETLDTPELVRSAVRELAAGFTVNARLLSVIMHRGAVDQAVTARGSAASAVHAERFERLLLDRAGEIRHPDPALAVDMCFRMVFCTLARQIMYGPTFESAERVGWDALVDELGDLCVGYLLRR